MFSTMSNIHEDEKQRIVDALHGTGATRLTELRSSQDALAHFENALQQDKGIRIMIRIKTIEFVKQTGKP